MEDGIRIHDLPNWVQIPPLVAKLESQNYILVNDHKLVLPCKSTGIPTPNIFWFKNGEKIEQDKDFKITSDGSLEIAPQGIYLTPFFRTDPFLYHKFENMVIFRPGYLY